MSAYLNNPAVWQESWDRQQEAFMPDREHRLEAMLDAVAAVTGGGAPRLLDLAGGTGSISLRTLARFPGAQVTVLDQDPVLLTIAESSLHTFGDRATIVDADLSDPGWRAKLPAEGFDAVLTATALHWLPAARVSALYAEIREVLRPGGVFANADHMPEEGLPELSVKLRDHARVQREARYASGASTSWPDWWARAAADPVLAPKAVERERIYPKREHDAEEWTPPASWHVSALLTGGFREAGVIWRGGTDAAVAGVR
ncbi:trans-aconitate methyltransferase [Actinoplanes lutulentus]|uniref:Methyltransferase family protein n=1 Tax=Actinoplanes lutulentus TaxID=1287878 RepID=A0A327ZD64_9ACTN|nr:class I SAM-dependent methyltransferase [Actinoplanes lutulentus]MBB2942745.1 trans-aconitate methyltransferase [Actinoplanes lutulentus]RAK38326.1 methyltransferase family protein [Actinoplanes lutulentus]